MEQFVVSLILAVLFGILLHTVIMFYSDAIGSIQSTFQINLKRIPSTIIYKSDLDKLLDESLYLNSFFKWKIWIYLFCFMLMIFLKDYIDSIGTNIILNLFAIVIAIIVLIMIGDFLHSFKQGGFLGLGFYLMKVCVLIIYMSSFTLSYLEDISNVNILMLTIILAITYSFLLVKNVVDSFSSYLFQFVNFIFILLFLNFVAIGLNFGIFYYENNETFNYFSEEEISVLNGAEEEYGKKLMYTQQLIVISNGLEPFFNFPSEINIERGIIGFTPLLEHVIGNIFNLLIIGFFVSYSVSKLFHQKQAKVKE